MTYLFKLARRGARFRAVLAPSLILTFAACNTDQLAPSSDDSTPTETSGIAALPNTPAFAVGFRGGISFGTSAQPTSAFGSVLNGGLRNIWPEELRGELAEIKSRGGKVVLMFAGNEEHYKDADGHFDFGKWKARVDRFKTVNFSDYVQDGTIVGHYLIDEPYDPFNWHGEPIPGSMIEEMAKYSKQLWPSMVTIVRAQPDQVRWSGTFQYLDAAWAQYTYQKGDIEDYIRENVADAQAMGLGLVVGLNITKGSPTKGEMTGKQVESWGSTLLSSTYPCAFISWQYNERHLAQDDMKTAMARLAQKAADRPSRSCSSGPLTLPSVSGITLKAVRQLHDGRTAAILSWSGAAGTSVDLFKNGTFVRRTTNDGRAVSIPNKRGTYTYRVCEAGKTRCSSTVTITL